MAQPAGPAPDGARTPAVVRKELLRQSHTESIRKRGILQRFPNTSEPSLSLVQQRERQDPSLVPDEELDKLEVALDQLERAELYIDASVELHFADPYRRRLLDDLRAQVAAVRRSLASPRVVDQTFSR